MEEEIDRFIAQFLLLPYTLIGRKTHELSKLKN